MKFWQNSLRTRLITYLLSFSLIPMLIIGGLAYYKSRTTLQAATIQKLDSVAVLKELEIDRWITEKTQLTRLLPQAPIVLEFAEPLTTLEATDPAFQTAYNSLNSYLGDVLTETPDFLEISILNGVGGKVVLSTNKEREGSFHVTDAFFVEGREETYVQNVYFSPDLNKTTITIASPLTNNTKQKVGVFVVHLNLDRLSEIILERSGLGATGETYLVDKLNVFVSQARGGQEKFPRGVHTAGIDKALAGENGAGFYENYKGEEVFGAYRWLENQDLALLAEIEQAEALAPINQFSRIFFSIGLFVTVIIVVVTFIIAGQISKPILAIAETAALVTAGDLDQRAPVVTNDEVGQLAQAFNRMTVQLHGLITGLEQRVAARTRALEASAEVSLQLSTILEQKQLLTAVVEQVRSAFNYYHVHIYLFDAAGENLVMTGGTGEAGATMLAKEHKIPRGAGLVGRAAEQNSVVLVPDVSLEAGWLPNPLLPDTKAEIAVPITLGDDVLGVLDVQHNVAASLTETDTHLLQSVSNQVAIALRNAHLFEQAQQQAEREALVNAISAEIRTAADIDTVLRTAARELGQALGAERTSVQLHNPGSPISARPSNGGSSLTEKLT